jgi:hypothetical protein
VCATLPDPEVPVEEETEEDEEGRLELLPAVYIEPTDSSTDEMDDDGVDGDGEDEVNEDMDVEDVQPSINGTHVNGSSKNFLSPLLHPLLKLIQPTSLSFPPLTSASAHPPTTSALSAIHICALECLNNMFLALAAARNATLLADTTAGADVWTRVWAALDVVGTEFGPGQERRKDIWEIGVGVLWGIGNVWKGHLVNWPLLCLLREGSEQLL